MFSEKCFIKSKIANDYKFAVGNVKNLVPNFFDKEKCIIRKT